MDRFAHLQWPFFDPRHATLSRDVDTWAVEKLEYAHGEDADSICRRLVDDLGKAGYLSYCVNESPDVRSIALIRETLAYHAGLADFAFVMQGLGSGPIVLAGSEQLRKAYLPRVAAGEAIAAFALSEPDAGSDVQAMTTTAKRKGDAWTKYLQTASASCSVVLFLRIHASASRASLRWRSSRNGHS